MKNRLLIIGPLGDLGGRELMTGFISSLLSNKIDVTVCSTEFITAKSQVYNFDSSLRAVSLKELMCKQYFIIKILAYFSYLKNSKKNKIEFYANNSFAKRFFNYEGKIKLILKELILDFDLVLINAQISSKYIEFIIKESIRFDKKVIFRTTGAIQPYQNFSYLNNVNLFIHHSYKNASQLKIKNHNYKIIDQCAFNEIELLKIPLVKKKIKVFLTIARLEKEKNIDVVIKSFLNVKSQGDILYIVGDGSELNHLIQIANNDNSIVFTGFVSNDKLHEYFSITDCVIISHYDFETGPLTGVEAMASARIILSAKTGAMEERLSEIGVSWFDNSVESLSGEIIKIKNLKKDKVEVLSRVLRDRYCSFFLVNKIEAKYKEAIEEVMNS